MISHKQNMRKIQEWEIWDYLIFYVEVVYKAGTL